MNIERAETARHAAVGNPRRSEREPMEIEEDEVASVAKTEDEDEDEDSPEDAFKRTRERPRPGSIYAIHMGSNRKSMLAANKDSELILWGYLDAEIGKNESQNCHWKCVNGPDDSLYFQNMKTGKYMSVKPERFHKLRPVVTSTLNNPEDNARLSIQRDRYQRLLIQTTIGQNCYYVMVRKNDGPLHNNGPQVVCSRKLQMGSPPIWVFRKIGNQ